MLLRLVDMTSPRTAIVVGGGPAGLVAAGRLAESGVATTLLEASAKLGGRAASEHRDGFDLNQGPHALYVGGPAMRELRRWASTRLGGTRPRTARCFCAAVSPRAFRADLWR